ncbi:FGGY-family carbohydrate kinase [Spirulina subsalsa FACHB-351]|uniref:FGGY-family carbohydrate kinase n=1 Tax=Spirulina subsalsa FACHB-351 TaxID=234711 RepID=A0ABT3L6Z3_9CYAN|nr:FGGY-family carbohydrate kinase [Spirulina subsalsa]MCW6036730.1 FGGY-family carbohydrate kinase [Spirulina subsalsa FACHB-351]
MKGLYLGLDFGTSGARSCLIDATGAIAHQTHITFSGEDALPKLWQTTLIALLAEIPRNWCPEIRAIALNGTSATVLLCDAQGTPITEPLLYNDPRAKGEVEAVGELLPHCPVVHSATSSLAKLLWWQKQPYFAQAAYFLHQADWLAFLLHGKLGISDYHNALKLGYDVVNLAYPPVLSSSRWGALLPRIVAPGSSVGLILGKWCDRFSFSPDCQICAGTTDSIAAFLASGATGPGEAVTSLGSTLVLKLLSSQKVDQAASGVYSHRLGSLWLTGGASNTGGAVLAHFFSPEELSRLSEQINPHQTSPLSYYPLLTKGDRFPRNDPNLSPQLSPRPDDPVAFLHGLLESMARLEAEGYQRLQELGATPLTQVYTAGGGAKNPQWTTIRQRYLCVPVQSSPQTEAAYGTAQLAYQNMARDNLTPK